MTAAAADTTAYEAVAARAAAEHLAILGGFETTPDTAGRDDDAELPPGTRSLLLLGPAEPGFSDHVTASPEWRDGLPDPIDRWSRRVIGTIACALGAKALFPFGGPPHRPFQRWALRTGRAWNSPVRLLVHDTAGLLVSFRGALALKERIALPPPPPAAPCESCAGRPCIAACPAGALGRDGYDVPACHAWLDRPEGAGCLSGGCAVRRACPVSAGHPRAPSLSAHHMRHFHR
jgi:epoxyqueuosine reductase